MKALINKEKKNSILENLRISDALNQMQFLKKKILFVINKNNKILGSITDGDLRRSYIKNYDASHNIKLIMNRKPFLICKRNKNNFKLTKKQKQNYKYAAIVDDQNKYLETVDLNHPLKKENIVFVMAGGKGERLRPLTKNLPKPLIKIYEKPHLFYLISFLIDHNFNKVYISVNYKANQIIKSLKWAEKILDIKYIKENIFLGTAGSLSLIKENIINPIIVINADIVTSINLDELINFHDKNRSDITICVKKNSFNIPYSVIYEKNDRIIDIVEKPIKQNLVNAGIYVINPDIIKKLIKKNKKIDMPEVIKKAIETNRKVKSFHMFEDWADYGSKQELRKLKNNYLKKIF